MGDYVIEQTMTEAAWMDGESIRCERGHVVGKKLDDGLIVSKAAGRVWIGRPWGIVCDCGETWRATSSTGRMETLLPVSR